MAATCLASSIALSACGGSQSAARDPVAEANQRLQGSWRVQSFTPEAMLEPPLQSLLNAQLGTLTVVFEGEAFAATGPGVTMNGRVQILSAEGDVLTGTLFDATGVGYRVAGQFQGSMFHFRSHDAPWRGTGVLQR